MPLGYNVIICLLGLLVLFIEKSRSAAVYSSESRSSDDRVKRWNKVRGLDEVEISINETYVPVLSSNVSIVSNSSLVEEINQPTNFNESFVVNTTEEQNPSFLINSTLIDEVISHENITEAVNSNDAISLIEETSPSTIEMINSTQLSFTTVDDINVTLNHSSNLSLKDAIIIEHPPVENSTVDTSSNDTVSIVSDFSLCNHCLYGFETVNDTCHCYSPCKNYRCFGNDTCVITEKDQSRCQPANGTEHDRPSRCYQPRDAGYHDKAIRYHNRWYYHPDQDTCHLFIYRGLGGNANNFQSLHECHLECIICAPLPDRGQCFARIEMWYYDYKTKSCYPFEYSGCKGNENKFLREDQCLDTCVHRRMGKAPSNVLDKSMI